MVKYKLNTGKTKRGYKITLYVNDGRCLKPLILGINRFFKHWKKVYEIPKEKDEQLKDAREE